MGDERYWATPEVAALESWSEYAQARFIDVEKVDDYTVKVHVKVGPDYDYFDYVWRSPRGWQASGGHN